MDTDQRIAHGNANGGGDRAADGHSRASANSQGGANGTPAPIRRGVNSTAFGRRQSSIEVTHADALDDDLALEMIRAVWRSIVGVQAAM